MKRKKQYLKWLKHLTEKQAYETAERFRVNFVYSDTFDLLSNYWIDVFWRNRDRLGLYILSAVCEAGLYDPVDVKKLKGVNYGANKFNYCCDIPVTRNGI